MLSCKMFRTPLRMFSTVVETPSGAKIFPTKPLAYSNLMGVTSWEVKASLSLLAGT